MAIKMSLPHVPIFPSKVKLSLPNNNRRVSLAEHVHMNVMQTREASQLVGQREPGRSRRHRIIRLRRFLFLF